MTVNAEDEEGGQRGETRFGSFPSWAGGNRASFAPPVSPVTLGLSRRIAGALDRPLPEDVVEKARHHILDTMASAVSGSRLKPGRMAISYVRSQGGGREATLVRPRTVTFPVNSALANGMMAHADDTDRFIEGVWNLETLGEVTAHPPCLQADARQDGFRR